MLHDQKAGLEAPPPTPQAPGSAPQAPVAATTCGIAIVSPHATYQALLSQRDELRQQLTALANRRLPIAERLRSESSPAAEGADKAGLQQRIANIDKNMEAVEAQILVNNQALACVTAIPGATTYPRSTIFGVDEDVFAAAGVMLFFLSIPIVIAWSRRIWRRGAQIVPQIPHELNERLVRIENTVESVAVELERVGEGQRFVTNLFIENGPPRALGAGAMDPIDVQQRERVAQERRDQ